LRYNLQPHLPGHVLGGLPRDHVQVAQQRGLDVAEQAGVRLLVTALGRSQHGSELSAYHRDSIGPAYRPPQREPPFTVTFPLPADHIGLSRPGPAICSP